LGVAHGDGAVVDTEKEAVLALPECKTLAGRELDQLERVAVGITKIDRADATGIWVPGRQLLRASRDRGRAAAHYCGIRPTNVGKDDGQMLKPEIVAAGIPRHRAARALNELDPLLTELQCSSRQFGGVGRLERKGAGVKGKRETAVRHRYDDRADNIDGWLGPGLRRGKTDPAEKGQRALHRAVLPEPSRSSKWSPTRSALAMIVKVGLTAALDGKKLASTT